jgi:TRAP-type transport system periplasmic protein
LTIYRQIASVVIGQVLVLVQVFGIGSCIFLKTCSCSETVSGRAQSMNIRISSKLAGVTFALAMSSTAAFAQTKWDMPTPYADGSFHTQNVKQFAADVKTATSGRLDITVHSNASLMKLPEIKRGVQTGQVQIGEVLMSTMGNEDAMFAVDSIPGLATSYPAAQKLWTLAKPMVSARLEKQGLIPLYTVAWPPQGIYAKKELNSLFDLKGGKFRAYNPATARFAEILGASAVTIQAAEIAQAFRTGVAESMISSRSCRSTSSSSTRQRSTLCPRQTAKLLWTQALSR